MEIGSRGNSYEYYPERKGSSFPRASRRPWRLHNSEPMGRRLRTLARRPWLPGVGHLERCLRHGPGSKGWPADTSELAAAGVKRISLATSLYRAAMTGLLDAACEVKDKGQFGFLNRCLTTPELSKLMRI
jgi:hypothetical protein